MSHSELHIRRELQSAIDSGDLRSELDLRRSLAEPTRPGSFIVEPLRTIASGAAAQVVSGFAGAASLRFFVAE